MKVSEIENTAKAAERGQDAVKGIKNTGENIAGESEEIAKNSDGIKTIDGESDTINKTVDKVAKTSEQASKIPKSSVDNVAEAGEATRKFVGETADEAEDLGKVVEKATDEVGDGAEKVSSSVKFSNWDDMKKVYKGTVTKFIKENKPKNSPNVKKWLDRGGTLQIENIDGKSIWRYTSSTGESVPYVDGYVKFPDKYLNPTIKPINIGEFTGDRRKDIEKMLDILEEDYGLTEIPDGYIVHHDTENGVLQLVDENIHKEFTHIGGHSIYK